MNQLVLFVAGNPLLLASVARGTEGRINTAWVVNGGWFLRFVDGHLESHRNNDQGSQPVSRVEFDPATLVEVSVPSHVKGNYNDVIFWAEQALHP